MNRNIHIHLHDASSVIQPTKPAASPKAPSPKPTIPPKSSTPPGSSNKPIHQAPTKPPAHEPLIAKSTEVVKKTGEAINKTSEAIERHRQQVTDDMSRTTSGVRVWGESPKKALAKDEVRKSGGVTTWGGVDPKKIVPKPTGLKPKPVTDAGTSEGAKKAAQTRKSHGSSAAPVNTRSNRGFIHPQELPKDHSNTPKAHSDAHVYHKQKAGFGGGNKAHGVAAALHQNAQHMQASPNPMMRSKANAISEKAWAASKAAMNTKDAGTSEGARKAAQTRKAHGGSGTSQPNETHTIFGGPREAQSYHRGFVQKHEQAAKNASKPMEERVAHNKAGAAHERAASYWSRAQGDREEGRRLTKEAENQSKALGVR